MTRLMALELSTDGLERVAGVELLSLIGVEEQLSVLMLSLIS